MKTSAVSILGIVVASVGAVWLLLLVTADNTAPNLPADPEDSLPAPVEGPSPVEADGPSQVAAAVEPSAGVSVDVVGPSAGVSVDVVEPSPAISVDVVEPSPDISVDVVEPSPDISQEQLELPGRVQLLDDGDLDSGSREFSAVTLNEELGRLVIADDGDRLYEYELDAEGLPVTPPRRVIDIAAGAGDTEGIAWISGSTFALAAENSGEIVIVDIGTEATEVGADQLVAIIPTGIAELGGTGLEGVAYQARDAARRYVVVREFPPELYFVDGDGAVSAAIPLHFGIADASDVAIGPAGSFAVLSDESGRVTAIRVDATTGAVTVIDELGLQFDDGAFAQPEGVAWSADGTRLYVVGEAPGPGQYSFAYFTVDS